MTEDKYRVVDEAMGKMDLEQKVGQLFTQSFYGSLITPDVVSMIKNMHCGGLRITSFYRQFRHYARPGQEREAFDQSSPSDIPPDQFSDVQDTLCKPPYLDIEQYAKLLNQLKEIAAERPYDVPLHMALDQEGNSSFDFVRGGLRYFPSQWGLARTGDPKHVYRCAKAIATQLAAVGFNVIHSPILDVVLHPDSTYIGTRAFGTDPDFVVEMARAFMQGFRECGIMVCGKHYPGRGSTDVDDHIDLAAIARTEEEMWNVELFPYRQLAPDGLPMIMIGHSVYPCWDAENTASCSPSIMQDVTRNRVGFEGIITTDSMIMLAIARKYGSIPAGCVAAAKAGANLILMKETGPIRDEAYRLVLEAAIKKELPEKQLDEQVMRTLRWKVDYGWFGDGYMVDPKKAERTIRSKQLGRLEIRAAEKAVHVVRDTAGLLPLSPDTRILVAEQIAKPHLNANDYWVHPGLLWEAMLQKTRNCSLLEMNQDPTPGDREKLFTYMEHYDVILITHYAGHVTLSTRSLIDSLLRVGKRVVVVANSPLPYDTPTEWPTVVCSYGVMPAQLKVVADLLFGDFKRKRPKVRQPWDR